ncbi:1-acyl-sn-glycerol-3-phosphate acyltransferase [Telmatospirillum sp. J64-1]|uniref:lysophospholipid acyltransferase family protein n=1 Tax=Telmatospirillum sp. J64-1 TaxID=2502183 RepID=UPI00115C4F3F|nr:lysophospholipid acyltransferase family protein [Telmatospirillum sp. J64-1]
MTALRSIAFSIAFYLWTVPLAFLYLPLLLAPRRWMVEAARFWIRGVLALLAVTAGVRHEVRGRENLPKGGCLIVAKHQSMWETLVFHTLLDDPAYILKKELTAIPFFGWYLKKTGMIAIDRKAGAKALRSMLDGAREAVAEGRQVIIFPEGTRTAPGETKPYHSGVAMLYGLDVPVVPVALNSGLFWGRLSFFKKPGTITLEFLPELPRNLDRRQVVAEVQGRIEASSTALKEEAERRFPSLVQG